MSETQPITNTGLMSRPCVAKSGEKRGVLDIPSLISRMMSAVIETESQSQSSDQDRAMDVNFVEYPLIRDMDQQE